MILTFYAIRDQLSGFMTPTLESNDAVAMRNFFMALDAPEFQSVIAYRPENFSLYKVAEFDTFSGIVTGFSEPELVVAGSSVYHDRTAADTKVERRKLRRDS